MDAETKCDRGRCGHELKWHDPCSRCRCHAFMAPMTPAERKAAGLPAKRG